MQVTETLSAGLKREFKVVVARPGTRQRNSTSALTEMAGKAHHQGLPARQGAGAASEARLWQVGHGRSRSEAARRCQQEGARRAQSEARLPAGSEASRGRGRSGQHLRRQGRSFLHDVASKSFRPFELKDFERPRRSSAMSIDVTDDHVEEALERIAGQYKELEDKGRQGGEGRPGDHFLRRQDRRRRPSKAAPPMMFRWRSARASSSRLRRPARSAPRRATRSSSR